MRIDAYILLLVFLFVFSSCKETGKEQISQLVSDWQGKEIVFPPHLVFTRYITDTTDYRLPQSEYKVLIYVDSMGCTSCKLQLPKWKNFIHEVDSVAGKHIPFLFFFHPKDYKEIRYLLKRDKIDFPVCIDTDDRLNKQNRFPSDITFQTFLLDKDNKVAVIGNPIHNGLVKNLYLEQITGRESPSKKLTQTTAEVITPEIDFGTFDKVEIKKASVEVKNTGQSPLVIIDVNTTCGCTAATYDKRPAAPGETLKVELTMTPKDTGFFDEVVTIQYNSTNNQPVKVKLKGTVR